MIRNALISRRPVTKYQQISQTLIERVRAGVYDEDGLPGERELASEFAVARVTVRHALHGLQELGLVTRKERRGTMATSGAGAPRPRRLLRELVDQFMDRGRIDQRRVLAFGFVKAPAEVAEALGIVPGIRVLRVVRVRSIGEQPLTYTETFVPEALGREVTRDALEKRSYLQVLEAIGVKIGDVEQIVAAEPTPPGIAEALKLSVAAPVMTLHRVVYDANGSPVQLLLGWYRADQFEIAMRMSRTEDMTRVWVRVR